MPNSWIPLKVAYQVDDGAISNAGINPFTISGTMVQQAGNSFFDTVDINVFCYSEEVSDLTQSFIANSVYFKRNFDYNSSQGGEVVGITKESNIDLDGDYFPAYIVNQIDVTSFTQAQLSAARSGSDDEASSVPYNSRYNTAHRETDPTPTSTSSVSWDSNASCFILSDLTSEKQEYKTIHGFWHRLTLNGFAKKDKLNSLNWNLQFKNANVGLPGLPNGTFIALSDTVLGNDPNEISWFKPT